MQLRRSLRWLKNGPLRPRREACLVQLHVRKLRYLSDFRHQRFA
jgi:hypothetical protein